MNRIMRNSGAALAAIFIAGSLTACGPGSASSSRSDTNPTEVSTDLGNKKYELTLWDGAGLKAVDEALIAGFEAKYPNITITGQYDPDNVSGQNGPRVISAKDAPDIARVTDMNSAVRGNHLVSLEAYVDAYGWDVPDSQTELYRVDSNGKLGSGDLYALPNSYSVTGIYFNTKLAEQLGIDAAPTSVEEFEADMQTAKDAGILPMMTYAKDGGTSFVFQALMANNSSAEDVQNWILQKSGTFDNQAAQDAASTLQDFNNAKNRDAAAAFLDYTQSAEAQQIIVDNSGYLPKSSTLDLKANSALQQSMFDAYADVLTSGHTSDFINNATAGMQSSGLIPNFQLLLDNSITPQEFTKNVQAQYDKEAKQ